jgi:DNA-binding transcriptional LysR family regulator
LSFERSIPRSVGIVDRLDAMKVFVTALDEGSLAGAGRKLGRSPAAVSRAIAFLEARIGAQLLHRTTRLIKMSEVGERYAATCRRVLAELEEADIIAGGERSAPRGNLSLSSPVLSGEMVLRPILDEFMDACPTVSARLYLLDRSVNLIEEGIDVALRIAHLPDSTLMAIRVGEVRLVVAAAPRYLALHPHIGKPEDLVKHQIIAMTHFGIDSWSFPPLAKSSVPRAIHFTPRLEINSVRGALASAIDGRGLTRLLSYQVAEHVREGELEIVLADYEHPPIPVHLILPHNRISVPKVRVFIDFAIPRLRSHFGRLAKDLSDRRLSDRSRRGSQSAE